MASIKNLEGNYARIEELNKKILDQEQQKQILHEEEKKLLEEGKTELQVQLGLLEKQNKFYKDSVSSIETLQRINDEILDNLTEKIENQQILTLEEEKLLDIALERRPLLEKQLEMSRRIAEENERQSIAVGKTAAYYEDIKESAEELFGNMFGFEKKWKGTLIGKFFEGIEKGRLLGGFKSVGSALLGLVNPMNILGNAATEAFYVMYQEQEKARAEFVKTTGVAYEYDKMIGTLGHGHIELGIDAKDATEAIISLRDGFSSYVGMSKQAQEETALFVASMNKLGIDTKTTSKNIEISSKVMGMNTKAAEKTQREIFALAQSIGVIPSKMAADFQAAAPRLAAHGEKMADVFKKLSVVAKRTGMDVGELLSITDQFDTFEGAADSVGKLNAILRGPYLDSVQMVMTTDPTERLKLMRDAISGAGKSFDTMSYYEKKAIGAAMGIQDMNVLSKMLSGNMEDVEEASKKEAITQQKMNELIEQARPLMEKMLDIMKQFAAFITPVVTFLGDKIGWLLTKFNALNDMLGKKLIPILFTVLGIWTLWKLNIARKAAAQVVENTVTALSNTIKGQQNAVLATNTGIQEANATATQTSAKVATSSIGPMLALGAAILMIGGGVFLAAYGLSLLVKSFKDMSVEQIAIIGGVLVAMGVGLYFLISALLTSIPAVAAAGVAFGAAAPGFLAFGASVLMIGGAFTGILWRISKVIESIASLGKTIGNFVDAFVKLLSFIKDIGPIGMLKVGIGLVALGQSLAGFAFGVVMLGLALRTLPTDDRSMKFTKMLESTSNISVDKVENVKRLVDESDRYYKTQNESKNASSDQFSKMLESVSKIPTSSGKGGGEKQPIILQLEGRVLKKFVIDVMNEQLNPRKI